MWKLKNILEVQENGNGKDENYMDDINILKDAEIEHVNDINMLKNKGIEHANDISMLKNKGIEHTNDISMLKNAANAFENQIKVLEDKVIYLEQEVHMLHECVLGMHEAVNMPENNDSSPKKLENACSLEESMKLLEKEAPNTFKYYKERIESNAKIYEGEPLHSCSVDGHIQGINFGKFINKYLNGYVLDVGCGPQEIPVYLRKYDVEKIYGLDPLAPHISHPFAFEQGLSEYIPWEDNSFNCVIFCTSLDHIFLIDRVINEIKRVLNKRGFLLVFVSFDENAPDYNPYALDFKPYDEYHMFHYKKKQFEEDFGNVFEMIEYFRSDVNAHFYAFQKKND